MMPLSPDEAADAEFEYQADRHARRERIATEVLLRLVSRPDTLGPAKQLAPAVAGLAVAMADALIAALDAEPTDGE